MWRPPLRASTNLVTAVDPPGGWAIWQAQGIVAWDQQADAYAASHAYRRARREASLAARFHYVATIERPYGAADNVQEVIQNAMATGWWLCETHLHSNLQWNPTAGQWRSWVGIHGDRKQCKEQAIDLARLLAKLQGIDPPMTKERRPAEHASEAWCMCLATWLRFGLVVHDDLAHRFIQATGMPYFGGGAVLDSISKKDALASGYAIRHKPHARKRKVKMVVTPKEDPYGNPFREAPAAQAGGEGRETDDAGPGGSAAGDVLSGGDDDGA